jgi:hypothetical protein
MTVHGTALCLATPLQDASFRAICFCQYSEPEAL